VTAGSGCSGLRERRQTETISVASCCHGDQIGKDETGFTIVKELRNAYDIMVRKPQGKKYIEKLGRKHYYGNLTFPA
jgi:hypothetical protein